MPHTYDMWVRRAMIPHAKSMLIKKHACRGKACFSKVQLLSMKMCSTCKQTKPLDEFYKHPTNKDGLTYECKWCMKERMWPTGYTEKSFRKAWTGQRQRCALCTVKMTKGTGPQQVQRDHDPLLKRPRELLCRTCNLALGHYVRHQRKAGLVIAPYESYLSKHQTLNA